MKDDTSTPIADDSPNEFGRDKAGTADRSRAEAAIEDLRREGGVFVNAVRATRLPMVLTDPTLAGNPIVFANDAFLKLSGYSMGEVLGQQPHFMNGPDTDPRDAARFREMVRADQDEVLETVQYRKNGSRFVATVLISGFKDDTGRTLHHFMSWLDVTRRVDAEEEVSDLRRTQKALQTSEAKYRGLLNSIDEGFCIIEVIFDGAGRAIDYVFLETNSAFERQAGIMGAVGRRMRDIAPDHEQHWFDTYGRIALTGEPERFEQSAKALGRHYDVYAFPVGASDKNQVGVLFNDIGERKRAESAARENQERQAFLLELGDAIRIEAEAEAKIRIAAQMLGERLTASRVLWAEYDWEKDLAHIFNGWFADGAQPFPAVMHLSHYDGEVLSQLKAGRTVRVDDVGVLSQEPAYAAIAELGVEALLSPPLLVDGILKVNLSVHQHQPRHWTDDEVALVEEVSERLWAEVVRARAERGLAESEELRTAMLDVLPVGIALVDGEGKVIICNREWERFIPTGVLPSREIDQASRWRSWHPDGQPVAPNDFPGARALRGEHVDPPMEFLFDDGEREIWTSVAAIPVRGSENEVVGAVDVIQDIDAAKRASEALRDSERHAQILLAELQHRVRNTLAVVRSIARRTADRSESMEDMVSHFEGRLSAFSRVQSAVTRNPEAGLSLGMIVEDELMSVAAREGEQFRVKGPEVSLLARPAESISLAIHELATNAVKYGALTSKIGRIKVSWNVFKGNGGVRTLRLEWLETGLGRRPEESHEGFGHEMLRRSLPYELGAETDIQFTDDGMRFTMVMPLGPEVLSKGRS